MKKFLLGLGALLVSGMGFTANAQDYYLIGGFNNWTLAQASCKFTASTNGEYVLDYQGTLTTSFKVNDGTWSNANANFGNNGSKLVEGQTYNLVLNGGNIEMDGNIENPHIVLNPTAKTLLITGQTTAAETIYGIHGNWYDSGWSTTDMTEENGKWVLASTTVPAGEFGIKAMDKSSKTQTGWYCATDANNSTIIPNTVMNVGNDTGNNFKNPAGTFKVVFDPQAMTIEFQGNADVNYPDSYYILGYVNGNDFTANKGVASTSSTSKGVYVFENVEIGTAYDNEYGFFNFAATISSDDSDWSQVTGRYGAPGNDDYEITAGQSASIAGGDKSFKILPGYYTITLDLPNMQVSVAQGDAPSTYPTLYLVGTMINGASEWGTKYPATSTDGKYTWNVDSFGSGFKVYDGDWNGSYNIGVGGGDAYHTLDFGTPFSYLADPNSVNIDFTDDLSGLTNATIVLDLDEETVTVTGTTYPLTLDAVYVAGTFSDWEENMTSFELKSTSDNVYTGTFEVELADPTFKVVFKLGESVRWYGASADSAYLNYKEGETYNLDLINVSDSNITLADFEEGQITFTVDYAAKTLAVSATNKSTGVEKIESAVKGADVIYNLQGVRVNNATKGLYIINGKKVLVK